MNDHRDLWAAYQRDPTDEHRNRLAEVYRDIPRYHAERIHARLPAEVELDDLISDGYLGLLDAIPAYDPERGIKFSTFSAPRIRGAIIDGLREQDWVPRLVRDRGSVVAAATKTLTDRHNRPPTPEELIEYLDAQGTDGRRVVGDAYNPLCNSLSHVSVAGDTRDVTVGDHLTDDRPPVDYRLELAELVQKAMSGLRPGQRRLLEESFFEGKTLKTIAELRGLTESRISQLRTQILELCRRRLAERPRRRKKTKPPRTEPIRRHRPSKLIWPEGLAPLPQIPMGVRPPPPLYPPKCLYPDCKTRAQTRGLCNRHYQHWRIYADPRRRTCQEPGCTDPHFSKGLCNRHYKLATRKVA